MYENFNASSSESLDSIFTRLQKIVSQLAILGTNQIGINSTNDVNISNVLVNTASSSLSTASSIDNTARLSDATIYAFLAKQPNGSQVVHEDLEQIHEDSDTAGYDKKKVDSFNCHKMGHFARECRNPKSQENRSRNQDSSRRTVNVEESSSKAMLAIDGAVAPPPTGLFAPYTIDLSNSCLEEFKQPEFEGYGVKVKKNVSENSSNEIKKTSSAPIIEDWVSDCDEDKTVEKVSKSANV
ncbi:ribonuclease H-like domain-containing protein [Tanacetum coccineum]